MVLNIIAIIIGISFNIGVLHTYQYGRLGYNGIILSQGMTPYVYMSSTVIFYVKKDYKMLILVLMASVISGIKGVILGEFVLILLILYFNENLNKRLKLKIGVVCFVSFLVLLSIIFNTSTFKEIIHEDGLISAIFSYRIDNLIEIMETSPAESYNYFIGAVGLETTRMEMQLIDILLFFGILGVAIYLFFMVSFYKDVLKSNYSKAFFFAALFLSLLSGNLLYIPFSLLLFFITCFSLNQGSFSCDQAA